MVGFCLFFCVGVGKVLFVCDYVDVDVEGRCFEF